MNTERESEDFQYNNKRNQKKKKCGNTRDRAIKSAMLFMSRLKNK